MAKITTLFPNYVFEGKLEISKTVKSNIMNDTKKDLQSGKTRRTNYGLITEKEIPLEKSLQNLSLLMGNTFVNCAKKQFLNKDKEVHILNPYLISIDPDHNYPLNMESCRWYNGCVWLQTTNKGNHLYFEDFSVKTYADRHKTQNHKFSISPEEYKYVFWPSHIPWGLTPNQSMIDTIVMCLTFLVRD